MLCFCLSVPTRYIHTPTHAPTHRTPDFAPSVVAIFASVLLASTYCLFLCLVSRANVTVVIHARCPSVSLRSPYGRGGACETRSPMGAS